MPFVDAYMSNECPAVYRTNDARDAAPASAGCVHACARVGGVPMMWWASATMWPVRIMNRRTVASRWYTGTNASLELAGLTVTSTLAAAFNPQAAVFNHCQQAHGGLRSRARGGGHTPAQMQRAV